MEGSQEISILRNRSEADGQLLPGERSKGRKYAVKSGKDDQKEILR